MNINILVVEDEPLMRKMYTSFINESNDTFSLVGCARNGREAIDILHQSAVDIVITDLKMPEMSGIELIRACKTDFPTIKFVVISGYDDFSLVREAFSLGVKNYFLKYEIDSVRLRNILLNIVNEINDSEQLQKAADNNELGRLENLESIIGISHYILREKLLKELIWSPNDMPALKKRIEACGMQISEKSVYVMLLLFHEYFDYEKNQWNDDRELLKYAILNVLEEICQKRENIYVFCNFPNEYIFLLSNAEENSQAFFNGLFDEIKAAVNQCFTLDCVVGISNKSNSFAALKELYHNAKFAADYSYLQGFNKLIFHKNIKKSGTPIQITELVLELRTVLNSFNRDTIKESVAKLKINPDSIGYEQIDDVKNLFFLYYNEIKKFLKVENLEEEINEDLLKYSTAEKLNTLSEMNKWLTAILNTIADIFTGKHLVVKVKSYVKKHYKEHIVLKDIADMLQVSESHLSRVFTKEQKETFTQYLLKIRMDAAIELMKTTNMKIYEIADEVGYSNSQQFSKMFRKITGKAPTDFLK